MRSIRLSPHHRGRLIFDLKEVLAALGPSGLALHWTVGDVDAHGEHHDTEFDATGEGAVALEKLAVSGERISGRRLANIAKSVRQVIWGEFKGYEDELSDAPSVVVVAFDASWWEIQSEETTLLDRVARAFQDDERS
jgi:hypothetical protein